MKKLAKVGLTVILAVMILLYIQIQGLVPVQEQGEEISLDTGDNAEEGDDSRNAEREAVFRASAGGGIDCKERRKGNMCPLPEEQEVLHAYVEFLQQYCEKDPGGVNWMKIDLIFVDANDIPELAVILSDSHADGVDIYVYHDGDVVEAGRGFGSRGAFLFLPRGNLICSTFFNMGEGFVSFYRIEGAESMELQAFHDCLVEYSGRQDLGDLYEVDGIRVSGEEYEEAWAEWEDAFEELILWGYDDAVPIRDFDGIDDLYAGLCRRFFLVNTQRCAEKNLPAVSCSGRTDISVSAGRESAWGRKVKN